MALKATLNSAFVSKIIFGTPLRTISLPIRGLQSNTLGLFSSLKTLRKFTTFSRATTSQTKEVGSGTGETEFKNISEVFKTLPVLAPVFPAVANDIVVLNHPKEFYDTLKKKIKNSKKNITLASLYIGPEETELISLIKDSLQSNKDLKVHFLLDCLRGTRKTRDGSSVDGLLPLLDLFGERVSISLYHTPKLNGWAKKLSPGRYNETIGLMHLKAYIFDEDVILSGANLSHDYFTNRQDRYYVFNNNYPMSNYFQNLIRVISDLSYDVIPNSELPVKYSLASNNCPDPVYDSEAFKSHATSKVIDFLQDIRDPFGIASFEDVSSDCDTVVVPVVQMGQLNILQDQKVMLYLLNSLGSSSRFKAGLENRYTLAITSGYFNFNQLYQKCILSTSALFRIITASPQANGFYNSKGASRYIPDAYTLIERDFMQKAIIARREKTIKIEEYSRAGWTYHAKGLWVTRPKDEYPFMTSIGSPNFGYRSLERDLEAQALIITSNPRLRFDMKKELENIESHITVVDREALYEPEREPRMFAKFATRFVRSML